MAKVTRNVLLDAYFVAKTKESGRSLSGLLNELLAEHYRDA